MKIIDPIDNAATRGARKQAMEDHKSMLPAGSSRARERTQMRRSIKDIRENIDHVGCDNDTAVEMCDEIEGLREALRAATLSAPSPCAGEKEGWQFLVIRTEGMYEASDYPVRVFDDEISAKAFAEECTATFKAQHELFTANRERRGKSWWTLDVKETDATEARYERRLADKSCSICKSDVSWNVCKVPHTAAIPSPPRRGVEREKIAHFVDFVNLWCHRANVTDAERISVIKNHPVAVALLQPEGAAK